MANRYWVSNTQGNWSDANNWGITSGGAGGYSPPIYMDNVIFDSNGDGNCIIDQNLIDVTGAVRSITVSGYVGNIYNASKKINIEHNLAWHSAGTLNLGSGVIFVGGNLRVSSGTLQTNRSIVIVNSGLDLSGISTFTYHDSGVFVLGGSQVAGTDNVNFSNKGFPTLIIDSELRTKKFVNSYPISGYSIYGYKGTLDPNNKSIHVSGKMSLYSPFSFLKSNTTSISVSGKFVARGFLNSRIDLEFPSPVTLNIQSGMGAIAHANVSNITSNNELGVFNTCDPAVDPQCGDEGSNVNLTFDISPCSLCYLCGSGGTIVSPTVPQTPNIINITVAGVTNSVSGMFDLCRDSTDIRDYSVVGVVGGVRQWEISSPNCNIAQGTTILPREEAALFPPYIDPIYDIALTEDAPCRLTNAHESGAMVCVGCNEYNGSHDLIWTPVDIGQSRVTCHWKKCFDAPCRVANMRVRDFADINTLSAYNPFNGLPIKNYNWVDSDFDGIWELLECTGYLPHLCPNACSAGCYSDLGDFWHYYDTPPNRTIQALLFGNDRTMQYPSFTPDSYIALYSIQPVHTYNPPQLDACTPDMTDEECEAYLKGINPEFGDLYLVVGKYCDICDDAQIASHTGGYTRHAKFDYNCDWDVYTESNPMLSAECGSDVITDLGAILNNSQYQWYNYSVKDYACVNLCAPGDIACYNENDCLRRLFHNNTATMVWKINREEWFPATGFPHCMDDMYPITFTYQHLLTPGMRIGECDFSNATITLNSASGPLETGNCAPPGCTCCKHTSSSTSSSSSSSLSSSSTSSSSSLSSSSSAESSSSVSSSSSSISSSAAPSSSSSSSEPSSSSTASSSSSSSSTPCRGCEACENVAAFDLTVSFPEGCLDRCEGGPDCDPDNICVPPGDPFNNCPDLSLINGGAFFSICVSEEVQNNATCVFSFLGLCSPATCLSGGIKNFRLLCTAIDGAPTSCQDYWHLTFVDTCNGVDECIGVEPGLVPDILIEDDATLLLEWHIPYSCNECCNCDGVLTITALGVKF